MPLDAQGNFIPYRPPTLFNEDQRRAIPQSIADLGRQSRGEAVREESNAIERSLGINSKQLQTTKNKPPLVQPQQGDFDFNSLFGNSDVTQFSSPAQGGLDRGLQFLQDNSSEAIQQSAQDTLNAPISSPETAQEQLTQETNPFIQSMREQAQMANDRATGIDAAKMQAYNQQQSNNAMDATERARLNAVVRAGAAGNSSLKNDYTRFQAAPISMPKASSNQGGFSMSDPSKYSGNASTFMDKNVFNPDGSRAALPKLGGDSLSTEERQQKALSTLFSRPTSNRGFTGVMSDEDIRQVRRF